MHQEYSFDVSDKEVTDFWSTVEQALAVLLKVDPLRALAYKRLVDLGSPEERLLILHDDPYNIALEISGKDFTYEEKMAYFESIEILEHNEDNNNTFKF